MHLDAAKAVPAVGEANFLLLVCLGLLIFFIVGTMLLCDQGFVF